MAPLADEIDLEGRLGRSFSVSEYTQATLLLEDASAAVRGYTGQEFTPSTTTTRLRVNGGIVRLPQRPVTAVTLVKDMNAATVDFTWHQGDRVDLSANVLAAASWEPQRGDLSFVDITYTHGSEIVPLDIVAVVCQMAGRALGNPADQSGTQTESIDDYSYTLGGAAAAGPLGMLADEKAVLDRYRRVGGSARVAW